MQGLRNSVFNLTDQTLILVTQTLTILLVSCYAVHVADSVNIYCGILNDYLLMCLIRLDAGSSLHLYEEMVKEHADFLPLHVARLHALDSEQVTISWITFCVWHCQCH